MSERENYRSNNKKKIQKTGIFEKTKVAIIHKFVNEKFNIYFVLQLLIHFVNFSSTTKNVISIK